MASFDSGIVQNLTSSYLSFFKLSSASSAAIVMVANCLILGSIFNGPGMGVVVQCSLCQVFFLGFLLLSVRCKVLCQISLIWFKYDGGSGQSHHSGYTVSRVGLDIVGDCFVSGLGPNRIHTMLECSSSFFAKGSSFLTRESRVLSRCCYLKCCSEIKMSKMFESMSRVCVT